ncbi:hypothetical protein ACN20G_20295 [Streptomyces sp. BI20]|uniref:hypothetical protein n=1 Tax=Streptomyces sp. BI20 TaxID=3403460 RepID=UPI003C71187E
MTEHREREEPSDPTEAEVREAGRDLGRALTAAGMRSFVGVRRGARHRVEVLIEHGDGPLWHPELTRSPDSLVALLDRRAVRARVGTSEYHEPSAHAIVTFDRPHDAARFAALVLDVAPARRLALSLSHSLARHSLPHSARATVSDTVDLDAFTLDEARALCRVLGYGVGPEPSPTRRTGEESEPPRALNPALATRPDTGGFAGVPVSPGAGAGLDANGGPGADAVPHGWPVVQRLAAHVALVLGVLPPVPDLDPVPVTATLPAPAAGGRVPAGPHVVNLAACGHCRPLRADALRVTALPLPTVRALTAALRVAVPDPAPAPAAERA